MFMFRGKKKALIKRLLRESKKPPGDETRRALEELLNDLEENQLKMLLTAVGCRDQESSKCVLLLRENEPHVLCCQAFNWPDLRQGNELRRLPMCRSACDPVYVCCNPWHWSRLCQPGEWYQITPDSVTYFHTFNMFFAILIHLPSGAYLNITQNEFLFCTRKHYKLDQYFTGMP